jgi:hypothetical protein
MTRPKLFLVNPVAAFDLAVLPRPARPDIPMANTCRLYGQREPGLMPCLAANSTTFVRCFTRS